MFNNLKPGGYFEINGTCARLSSNNGTHKNAEITELFYTEAVKAADKFGKPIDAAHLWREKLEKAGFIHIDEFVFKVFSLSSAASSRPSLPNLSH